MLIRSIRIEAQDVRSFELVPMDGAPLPAWSPGAHVQVELPVAPAGSGRALRRAYSLCNHPGERNVLRIAVKLEAASRGGSQAMHALTVGQQIMVGAPQNLFEIDPVATHHVLLAGGIGITPLYAMFNALTGKFSTRPDGNCGERRGCELHYFVRSPAHATFIDRLAGPVQLHAGLDAERTASMLRSIVSAHAADPLCCYYTCGPAPFMAAVEATVRAAGLPAARLRLERFGSATPELPAAQATAVRGSFRVVFAKAGIEADVPVGVPIIEIARQCGVDIPVSCEQGVCGACQSDVLEGEVAHCDDYLSKAERASGKTMLPCVSRCAGERLVLDR